MNLIRRFEGPLTRKDFFSEMFPGFFDNSGPGAAGKIYPAIDIVEEKEKYVVKADLPGIKQEDVKVGLEDNMLTISGEKKNETEEKDGKNGYHYYERTYGSFERRMVLPANVDPEKIKAKVEHGVLRLEIPKIEAKKPKEIKVE